MDSFFTLSKVLWFFAAPSNLALTMVALALVFFRWRGACAGFLVAALLLLGGFGLSPLTNMIATPLEDRFPLFVDDGRPVDGIVMLGGAEVPDVWIGRGSPTFNDAGERALAFADLARRYPAARLAFVGGSGALFARGEFVEARMMKDAMPMLGVDVARVSFEDKSRNTVENAVFSRALLKPQPGERWLLVTSAWHMPRAIGTFRAAGFPVIAYPVDFRTAGSAGWGDTFSRVAWGLNLADVAVREWIGLVAYRLTGRTDALLPGPG